MRVGIVTQPLRNNYGGILQNYALQRALERLGHQAVTINMLPQLSLWRYVLSTGKSLLLYFIPGKKRPFAPYCRCKKPLPQMREFIGKRIACTETVSKYSPGLIGKYRLDCLVAGSDQIWRPRYNKHLEDMFLRFARHADVKRVAYGASFGVDGMEFSRKQLRRCTPLLQKFDRVSVREASGVALCREYFQAEAEHVLDPVMLLTREDYADVCKDIPVRRDDTLACYILDMTEELRECAARIARNLHLKPLYFMADNGASVSVEMWLSTFRDAEYVITDSFHGCVFSILFNKPFLAIGNKARGMARFESLTGIFGLRENLVAPEAIGHAGNFPPIDWGRVNARLKEMRALSMSFLKESLQ